MGLNARNIAHDYEQQLLVDILQMRGFDHEKTAGAASSLYQSQCYDSKPGKCYTARSETFQGFAWGEGYFSTFDHKFDRIRRCVLDGLHHP